MKIKVKSCSESEKFPPISPSPFTILLFLVKPYVIKAPENVSAVAGDEIDLACVVGGRPKPELQWIRQNGDIPPNRAIVRENSVLNLRNVSPDDQDTYICRADNPAGAVEVKASVQVHCESKLIFTTRLFA